VDAIAPMPALVSSAVQPVRQSIRLSNGVIDRADDSTSGVFPRLWAIAAASAALGKAEYDEMPT
jgi:hypothetical protein